MGTQYMIHSWSTVPVSEKIVTYSIKKITFHVVVLFENYDQVFPSLNHKRHSLDTTLKILIECRKSISNISCLKYGVSSPFKESEIITLCFVAKCEYWSILGDNNIVIGHFEKLLTL